MDLPAAASTTAARTQGAWAALAEVLDPEVPALSICDLGIVREVIAHTAADGAAGEIEVVLTPTYSGCPATEAIEQAVLQAMAAAGLQPARVSMRRAPAWTTDWMSAEGKRKLTEYGIAPPGPVLAHDEAPIRFFGHRDSACPACPRCNSMQTERLSAFGSTACKAMYRCLSCREPFEHFKPI